MSHLRRSPRKRRGIFLAEQRLHARPASPLSGLDTCNSFSAQRLLFGWLIHYVFGSIRSCRSHLGTIIFNCRRASLRCHRLVPSLHRQQSRDLPVEIAVDDIKIEDRPGNIGSCWMIPNNSSPPAAWTRLTVHARFCFLSGNISRSRNAFCFRRISRDVLTTIARIQIKGRFVWIKAAHLFENLQQGIVQTFAQRILAIPCIAETKRHHRRIKIACTALPALFGRFSGNPGLLFLCDLMKNTKITPIISVSCFV